MLPKTISFVQARRPIYTPKWVNPVIIRIMMLMMLLLMLLFFIVVVVAAYQWDNKCVTIVAVVPKSKLITGENRVRLLNLHLLLLASPLQ